MSGMRGSQQFATVSNVILSIVNVVAVPLANMRVRNLLFYLSLANPCIGNQVYGGGLKLYATITTVPSLVKTWDNDYLDCRNISAKLKSIIGMLPYAVVSSELTSFSVTTTR